MASARAVFTDLLATGWIPSDAQMATALRAGVVDASDAGSGEGSLLAAAAAAGATVGAECVLAVAAQATGAAAITPAARWVLATVAAARTGRPVVKFTDLVALRAMGSGPVPTPMLQLLADSHLLAVGGPTVPVAVREGYGADTVSLLLAAGASPLWKDALGLPPLLTVFSRGTGPRMLSLLRALLRGGADPNAADAQGLPPLLYAARLCPDAVAPLLAGGAEPAARAANSDTAVTLALRHATANTVVPQVRPASGVAEPRERGGG